VSIRRDSFCANSRKYFHPQGKIRLRRSLFADKYRARATTSARQPTFDCRRREFCFKMNRMNGVAGQSGDAGADSKRVGSASRPQR
jgi:hypothetical protein